MPGRATGTGACAEPLYARGRCNPGIAGTYYDLDTRPYAPRPCDRGCCTVVAYHRAHAAGPAGARPQADPGVRFADAATAKMSQGCPRLRGFGRAGSA